MSQLSLDIMQRQRSGSRQIGFSLIELMVAMVISLLIMGAVLTLFLDVTRTNDDMAKTNAQIENGRFSLQMIGNDLMHAGFWDGYIPEYDDLTATAAPTGFPADFVAPGPCLDFASWTSGYTDNLLRMPVQSFNGVPSGCEGVVQNRKADTDVLVVRHVNTCVADAPGCAASDPSRVYFQTSFCSTASPYDYVLGKSGFTLEKRDCLSSADKRRFVAHIYFIRDDNTLMRAEFVAGTGAEWSVKPMIDGVEHFVVELGVDNVSDSNEAVNYAQPLIWADPLDKVSPRNRGDGAPDGNFVRCPATGCMRDQLLNVVAAKLYLLVRSPEASPGYTDSKTYTLGSAAAVSLSPGGSFKRHLYSSSVRLHNVSARRETP